MRLTRTLALVLLSCCLLLSTISCTPTPAVKTQTVTVYQDKYVPLDQQLVTAKGMPQIPAVMTQNDEDVYIPALQAALREDICKLDTIYSLQPMLAAIKVRCTPPKKGTKP